MLCFFFPPDQNHLRAHTRTQYGKIHFYQFHSFPKWRTKELVAMPFFLTHTPHARSASADAWRDVIPTMNAPPHQEGKKKKDARAVGGRGLDCSVCHCNCLGDVDLQLNTLTLFLPRENVSLFLFFLSFF